MRGGKRNRSGRPKGSANKKTLEWQAFGEQLMSRGVARAKRIMDKADDETFMVYFFKLAEFFKSKPRQAMDVTFANPDVSDILKMNSQELDHYIENFEKLQDQDLTNDNGTEEN